MNSTVSASATAILAPSYRLPLGLAIAALAISFLNLWLGAPLLLFAVFLTIQTATLRLHFTEIALEIYRGKTLIRNFPYAAWMDWQIFWSPVPILFYFREIESIHFLPILFDPAQLKTCLERCCPRMSAHL
jgi:Protein of unknown function (DUF3119)